MHIRAQYPLLKRTSFLRFLVRLGVLPYESKPLGFFRSLSFFAWEVLPRVMSITLSGQLPSYPPSAICCVSHVIRSAFSPLPRRHALGPYPAERRSSPLSVCIELALNHRLGREIPSIGFGTWKMGNGDGPISQVDQAISVGFSHVGASGSPALEVGGTKEED